MPHFTCQLLLSFALAMTFFGQPAYSEVPGTAATIQFFDQASEFPNYFSETTPAHLEEALASIFRRLEVPVVVDGQVQSVRYFEHLQRELETIDPKAEVVPSGGVVRAVISHIYERLHMAKERDPDLRTTDFLQNIAKGSAGIMAFEVRGLGSDFDLLLYHFDPAKSTALRKHVEGFTNSSEEKFNMRASENSLKRLFFTVGDIKEYKSQIDRATSQGGCDLDFLAFSLKSGKLITPPGFEEIVPNFFKGAYRYLAPRSGKVENSDKQTIRGFRPLVEMPFLRVLDETVLRAELETLLEKVRGDRKLDSKALEQFTKMVRNSRFLGGHNRIYRSGPNSIEARFLDLVLAIPRDLRQSHPPIPEFVDRFPLGRASSVPPELLIPVDEFIRKYTDNGYLFHGTPEIEKGMAILRGGLFVSGGKGSQGLAVFGRGGYMTKERDFAASYAGVKGMILRLPARKDPRLRILDWEKAKNHPWLANFKASIGKTDLYEALARQQGIDFVVNHHVLLQNIEGVVIDKNLRVVLETWHDSLTSQLKSVGAHFSEFHKLISDIQEFRNLRLFYMNLTASQFPDVDTRPFSSALIERLENGSSLQPEMDYALLRRIEGENSKLERGRIWAAINTAGTYVAKAKYAILFRREFSPSADESEICQAATGRAAAGALAEYFSGRLANNPGLVWGRDGENLKHYSSTFWDVMRHHNPGLSVEQIIDLKIVPLLKSYDRNLDAIFNVIGEYDLLADSLINQLLKESRILHSLGRVQIWSNSVLLPEAEYSESIRRKFNEHLAGDFFFCNSPAREILRELDRKYANQSGSIQPWTPVVRKYDHFIDARSENYFISLLSGPYRQAALEVILKKSSVPDKVLLELRKIIRAEYPGHASTLSEILRLDWNASWRSFILEELQYALGKDVLNGNAAPSLIEKATRSGATGSLDLSKIPPNYRRILLNGEFNQTTRPNDVKEWLRSNLASKRITPREHQAYSYAFYKKSGIERAAKADINFGIIPSPSLARGWKTYLERNDWWTGANFLRDLQKGVDIPQKETLVDMYVQKHGLYSAIYWGLEPKHPSRPQLGALLNELKKWQRERPDNFGNFFKFIQEMPLDTPYLTEITTELFRLAGNQIREFLNAEVLSRIENNINLSESPIYELVQVAKGGVPKDLLRPLYRILLRQRNQYAIFSHVPLVNLNQSDLENILLDISNERELPEGAVVYAILPIALSGQPSKAQRLASNILFNQTYWSATTGARVLSDFSEQPYGKKVLIARKIAAMRESWNHFLWTIQRLESTPERPFMEWMKRMRQSIRGKPCESLLLDHERDRGDYDEW